MTQKDSGDKAVEMEISDGLAVLMLNRPDAYNALNMDLGDDLLDALIECDENPGVRAVLISGRGAAFCAGGDIRQMKDRSDADGNAGRFLKQLTVRLHAAISTMARMPKPVVTAVNGPAAGAGFSLAIAGDLVLAAETARFTMAYTGIALAPDGSSTFYLPRLVGMRRAYELICSNRALTAAEARDLGLVTDLLPADGFLDKAKAYASKLAAGPTGALAEAKKLLALSAESSLETQMEHERRAIAACGNTDDFREGVDAFLNKRPPRFGGQ